MADSFVCYRRYAWIAPLALLKFVRCNCRGSCSSSMFSCRKNGLHCVSACGHCHGTDCSNTGASGQDILDNDNEPDIVSTDFNSGNLEIFLDDEIGFFMKRKFS